MRRTISVCVLFLIVFSLWATYPFWLPIALRYVPGGASLGELGTSGDSYGALNTLFSGLAFAGIIISILLQSKELQETRAELEGQKEQFILQNASLSRQVFENTFFQLIHLHNEITGAVSQLSGHFDREREVRGRKAIGFLFAKYIEKEHRTWQQHVPEPQNSSEEFELFHLAYHDQLGHYFRNVYQILKFVDMSEMKEKKIYTNLLRAQLSSEELALLFYNCLSEYGREKFKPLTEKYALFEHLPVYSSFSLEDARSYEATAFGSSPQWAFFLASDHANPKTMP